MSGKMYTNYVSRFINTKLYILFSYRTRFSRRSVWLRVKIIIHTDRYNWSFFWGGVICVEFNTIRQETLFNRKLDVFWREEGLVSLALLLNTSLHSTCWEWDPSRGTRPCRSRTTSRNRRRSVRWTYPRWRARKRRRKR